MPTLTDVVLLCFLLFFLLDGWRKGFLKSAIGPMAFAFCALLGTIYFDLTQNFVKAILYTITGSATLTLIILLLLSLGKSSVDPMYRDYSPLLGRMLGSAINAAWQGVILAVTIFFISIAPFQVYGLTKVQGDIQQSFSYSLMVDKGLSKVPILQKIVTALSIFRKPELLQRLSSTSEFREFFSNSKVQLMLNDENFMKNVNERNIVRIMANPKFLNIFEDNSLMELFGRMAGKVYSLDLSQETSSNSNNPQN